MIKKIIKGVRKLEFTTSQSRTLVCQNPFYEFLKTEYTEETFSPDANQWISNLSQADSSDPLTTQLTTNHVSNVADIEYWETDGHCRRLSD